MRPASRRGGIESRRGPRRGDSMPRWQVDLCGPGYRGGTREWEVGRERESDAGGGGD